MKQSNIILKYALQNAFEYGKINPKVILGLTLKESPHLKQDVPRVMQEISATILDVEKLSKTEIKTQLTKIAPELLQKKVEEVKGLLKPLPEAKAGLVKLRIAPSPSGPLHVGHAYGASLNHEYAKMYNGKLILRIEDTNPEKIYPPAYDLIEKDVNWLTENDVSQVVLQSSRLKIYYKYAEQLISQKQAYVCTCDPDTWRAMKNNAQPCGCRDLPAEIRYNKMFKQFAPGEAVLRAKSDINHKNPAMRDFGIMRIVDHPHPKTGKSYRVWPLMIFSVAIDDHDLGITHVLNGKDQTDNAEKEKIIMNFLGWQPPVYKHWGKINFIGFRLKTSEIKLAIEQNEYSGWDDIRLPFLEALKNRGYQPASFRHFAREIGLSLTDKKVTTLEFWKMINAFNRDIVEPLANRYFFIAKPKEINLKNFTEKSTSIALHPDFPERGQREFIVNGKFQISEDDFRDLAEHKLHRLMDCCNFVVDGTSFRYVSDDYTEYKNSTNKGKIIHWLPKNSTVSVKLHLETGETLSGLGEQAIQDLPPNTIIQCERFAFCRVHKKNELWYLHK
jgi:glutamyl-tRNA synthetase